MPTRDGTIQLADNQDPTQADSGKCRLVWDDTLKELTVLDDTGTPFPFGNMVKSVYDPQAIEDDAFDQDNMTDGATNKNYTLAEQTKLAGIQSNAEVNTVDDVFGRTGNVIAQASDYDASQVDNDSSVTGAFVDDALNTLDTNKEDTANKGAANGYASLDGSGRIPSSQLPTSSVEFKGSFGSGGSTTGGDLPSSGNTQGDKYICDTNGYNSVEAGITFDNGDFALYDGSSWVKIDNNEAVSSVFGRVGSVLALASDYDASQVDNDSSVAGTFVSDALDTLADKADYFKDTVIVVTTSNNFNSNTPTNVPGLTYTITQDGDYVFYALVNCNNDQNEEVDMYFAVNGVTELNSIRSDRQQKNNDQGIDNTWSIDGLTNGDTVTVQFDTRGDNVDLNVRRMLIQSWNLT